MSAAVRSIRRNSRRRSVVCGASSERRRANNCSSSATAFIDTDGHDAISHLRDGNHLPNQHSMRELQSWSAGGKSQCGNVQRFGGVLYAGFGHCRVHGGRSGIRAPGNAGLWIVVTDFGKHEFRKWTVDSDCGSNVNGSHDQLYRMPVRLGGLKCPPGARASHSLAVFAARLKVARRDNAGHESMRNMSPVRRGGGRSGSWYPAQNPVVPHKSRDSWS